MKPERKSTTPKPYIFVLIPFDPKFNDIYKFGIKGAAEDVGAYAERVDEQIFTEGILERVFTQISKADVIVADMTDRNPNVFYEVGYAHALGKIVLLLTQNADDIPFDLKHYQHTVYGGKIETLRKELTERLSWAISEAAKQGTQKPQERFSINILGREIVESQSIVDAPVIGGTIDQTNFALPFVIRNASFDTTPNITHIYVFTPSDSNIVPCEVRYTSVGNVYFSTSVGTSPGPSTSLSYEPLSAISIDAPDGLTKQYRLTNTVSALPPSAVEEFIVHFMLKEKQPISEPTIRLRIHSSALYHDYPFKLKIEFQEKGTEDTGGDEESK